MITHTKSKKKKPDKDVIRTLIAHNEDLVQRDLQARLLKIKHWKRCKARLNLLSEDYDEEEEFFSEWHTFNDENVYYAMGSKYKTAYHKGD